MTISGSSDDHGDSTQDGTADDVSAEAQARRWYADERQRRADERAYWRGQSKAFRIGMILASLTVGGALLSACLSGVALIVSQRGTEAAWEAARHAQRQAAAAERQLRLSQEASQAAQTPTISVSVQPIEEASIREGISPTATVVTSNVGPGTAFNLDTAARMRVLPSTFDEADLTNLHGADVPEGKTLPPSATSGVGIDVKSDLTLTADDVRALCYTCNEKLVVFGDVTFKDSGGRTYRKDFCYSMGNRQRTPPNTTATAIYRQMEFCTQHQGQVITRDVTTN